ncbi:MAG: pyridoxamine 5'-phosphate oxidase [Acidimicrobiales bacterium]
MADPLDEDDLGPDPIAQFAEWFAQARQSVTRPDAVALATADGAGAPSVRMVLLKGWDDRGFVVFTNYESRKGHELADNRRAALVVYWEPLGRQVRATGTIERTSEEESDHYFATRPRGSQLAAHASHQSELLADRAEIEEAFAKVAEQYEGQDVPRPAFWGGFRLVPEAIEFWQHQENRLHDRFVYRRSGSGWRRSRLAP